MLHVELCRMASQGSCSLTANQGTFLHHFPPVHPMADLSSFRQRLSGRRARDYLLSPQKDKVLQSVKHLLCVCKPPLGAQQTLFSWLSNLSQLPQRRVYYKNVTLIAVFVLSPFILPFHFPLTKTEPSLRDS